jgi:methylglutaconyl-CoA hydratase
MDPSPVLVDATDPAVTVVTLNRPDKRNALSIALIEQLTAAIREAEADCARRVIVLRGAGPVFCAGLDLHEAADPATAGRSAEALAELYLSISRSPLVVIVAAQGAAFGGGAGLVAGADLVVAADDLKIGFPEVRRGLVAALVTCLVRRQVGDRTARELILLGQDVPAGRAMELGLVNRVVPVADLGGAALGLAREVCRGAPGSIARTKRLLDDLAARPLEEDLRRALAYHLEARHSAESAEGIAAFREKRAPRWGLRPVDDDSPLGGDRRQETGDGAE